METDLKGKGSKRYYLYIMVLFLLAGTVLVALPWVRLCHGEAQSRREVKRFEQALREQGMNSAVSERKPEKTGNQTDGSSGSLRNPTDIKQELVRSTTDSKQELPADTIGLITIEAIHISYVIREGAEQEQLAHHIGHMPETAGIGEEGNCVLAGHSGGRNGSFFKDLHKLNPGEHVEVTDLNGVIYHYQVQKLYVTDPYDFQVTARTETSQLTLMTCTNGGKSRLIAVCEPIENTILYRNNISIQAILTLVLEKNVRV